DLELDLLAGAPRTPLGHGDLHTADVPDLAADLALQLLLRDVPVLFVFQPDVDVPRIHSGRALAAVEGPDDDPLVAVRLCVEPLVEAVERPRDRVLPLVRLDLGIG